MLNHEVVPLTGAKQSHGIQITEEGPYFGMVFAFGALELMGKVEENLQIAFEYDIIKAPDPSVTKEMIDAEIGEILAKVVADSDITSDRELFEEEPVAHFNGTDPVRVELEDGTTIEIETVNEN